MSLSKSACLLDRTLRRDGRRPRTPLRSLLDLLHMRHDGTYVRVPNEDLTSLFAPTLFLPLSLRIVPHVRVYL